jgi:hypothetical protein
LIGESIEAHLNKGGFYQTASIGGRVNMICDFWPNLVLLAYWMMIFGYHYV